VVMPSRPSTALESRRNSETQVIEIEHLFFIGWLLLRSDNQTATTTILWHVVVTARLRDYLIRAHKTASLSPSSARLRTLSPAFLILCRSSSERPFTRAP
jgi:hypothetical protein